MFFSLAPPFCWSNLYTLLFLRDSGSTRQNGRVNAALDRVRDLVTWGPAFGNSPCFEGEVALARLADFGREVHAASPTTRVIIPKYFDPIVIPPAGR